MRPTFLPINLRRNLRPPAWLCWTVTVLLIGGITWLLLIPDPYRTVEDIARETAFQGRGYLIHCTVYAAMTVSLLVSWRSCSTTGPLAVLIVHCCLTEIAQSVIPTRHPDLWDVAANLVGITVGTVLVRTVLQHHGQQTNSPLGSEG